ncbi:hypothetical protein Q5692_33740 [Microcoleus sp. C2C3]|uniref:hypothetical protein n=1 Tax=unclassified Microcoleus TaxID=2642155 RepID=UPI002FCF4A18
MPPITGNCLCWRLQILTLGAENPTPEYWFGQFVDFCWVDENSGESHSETGIVVGIVWNQREREWQYMITWLASTIDPNGNYPFFTEELVPGEMLCSL